jgi:hypothetical protein
MLRKLLPLQVNLANEREDQLNHELDMCRAQEHSELSGQPWNQAMGTGWIVLEE